MADEQPEVPPFGISWENLELGGQHGGHETAFVYGFVKCFAFITQDISLLTLRALRQNLSSNLGCPV